MKRILELFIMAIVITIAIPFGFLFLLVRDFLHFLYWLFIEPIKLRKIRKEYVNKINTTM